MPSDTPTPARKTLSTAMALALAVPVLTLLVPAASATVVFTDGMETTAGWTTSGSTVSSDCSVAQAGVCSFKVDPACCATGASATRSTAITMNGITTVTFWFRPSFTWSDMDSNFVVHMNGGGHLVYHTTAGAGGGTSYSNQDGYSEWMGTYSAANAWYRGVINIHPGTDWSYAQLFSASGTFLGAAGASIPVDSTSITSIVAEGVEWGDTGDVVHYDSVSVDVSGSAPGAPTSLSVQRNGNPGELRITWNPPSSFGSHPFSHYRLYRATASSGPYEMIGTFGASDRDYTDYWLADNTRYYYRVGTVTDAGETRASANQITYGVPGAPVGLVAASTLGETTLTWSAPTSTGGYTLGEYRVYRGFASGTYEYLASTPGYSTSYKDTTCFLAKSCFYVVTAVNPMGEGPLSNEASAVGMAVPDGVDLAALATDSDGDGHTTADEILAHSDPTNYYSRPTTDDDCDGVQNRDEADLPAAMGIGHPVVEVTEGEVEFDPETLHFAFHPPHFEVFQEGSSSC